MSANFNPIYTLTPNIGFAKITTTAANVKSDGSGTVGTDMFLAFTSGPSGSFIQRARFNAIASAAAVNTVATTLRVFLSSVNTGVLSSTSSSLLVEVSVPGTLSTANSTNSVLYYDVPLNIAIPSSKYILITQHVAQTTNQQWQGTVFGGDY
jgi:hypothetical protein